MYQFWNRNKRLFLSFDLVLNLSIIKRLKNKKIIIWYTRKSRWWAIQDRYRESNINLHIIVYYSIVYWILIIIFFVLILGSKNLIEMDLLLLYSFLFHVQYIFNNNNKNRLKFDEFKTNDFLFFFSIYFIIWKRNLF